MVRRDVNYTNNIETFYVTVQSDLLSCPGLGFPSIYFGSSGVVSLECASGTSEVLDPGLAHTENERCVGT